MPRKGKDKRPNYKEMDSVAYAAIRKKYWYEDMEREFNIEDPRFWCMEQLFIFKDIYEPKPKVRPMQPIYLGQLSNNSHFADAVWVAERMGLHKIMKIKCNYSIPLIQQFYATLVIKMDDDRTMKWMSGSSPCEATFHKFGELLGYPFSDGHRLHHPNRLAKDILYDLYKVSGAVGTTTGLLPIYDQLLRFFWSTIAPSGGSNDVIRGALVDLLDLDCECAQDGD
jgi:hypothetical protein